MALPTPEELELIETFKKNVEDILVHPHQKEDMYLIRWIRARDNDLEKAEELFRNSMQWREENDIDGLMDRELDKFYFQHFTRTMEGHDKEGHPVISVPFGEWDVYNSASSEERIEEFRAYTLQGCEQLMDNIRKADLNRKSPDDPPISQCVLLIDMGGFSFMNLLNVQAVQHGLGLLAVYEANYPESLHSCILINCSSMISMLLSLVKPVLATKTYEKIKCYGPNQEEWQQGVLGLIDADQLPPRYGGTKEVPDEEAEEAEEALDALDDSDDEFVEACEDLALD